MSFAIGTIISYIIACILCLFLGRIIEWNYERGMAVKHPDGILVIDDSYQGSDEYECKIREITILLPLTELKRRKNIKVEIQHVGDERNKNTANNETK